MVTVVIEIKIKIEMSGLENSTASKSTHLIYIIINKSHHGNHHFNPHLKKEPQE